jgi:hypothetical protein
MQTAGRPFIYRLGANELEVMFANVNVIKNAVFWDVTP